MQVDADNSGNGEQSMSVEECLVKSMSDGRPGLDSNQEKGRGADGAPDVRRRVTQHMEGVLQLIVPHAVERVNQPGEGVKQSLKDGHSCGPPM